LPDLSLFALLVFPLLMAFAGFSDMFTMRISNRLVLILTAAFFVMALIIGMPLEQIGLHLACAAIVLIFAFAFFAFGWVGGGDAKLVAATTLWLGFAVALTYLIYAALLGGALTLILLAVRRFPLPEGLRRITWVDRLHDGKTQVPYGIALAAAGLIVYPETSIFQSLVG
jgi:prepilin peptidase CpaA